MAPMHEEAASAMECRRRRRRCARRRRPSAASLAVVATGLLATAVEHLALASTADDGESASAPWDPARVARRARAEGSLRGGAGKVNLLVKYKHGRRARRDLAEGEGGAGTGTWQSHAVIIETVSDASHIDAVEVDAAEVDLVLEELMDDEDVMMVEEDFIVSKSPSPYDNSQHSQQLRHGDTRHLNGMHNDTHRERILREQPQYGPVLTQATEVWELTNNRPNKYPNTPMKVCIVDTGYDINHEDLPKGGRVTGTETAYGDWRQDGDGHGTHCAGNIGAIGNNDKGIVGVNPNPQKIRFHISKALNDEGMGTASTVMKGIEGCISSGSKIISMSLGGGPESSMFKEIYERAYNNGVLVFAAAGNLGLDQHDYPASYPTVVSIAAANKRGEIAHFNNYNNQVELLAPGVDILSSYPGSKYAVLSGTSMATPFAAGLAALVWGYFPKCSNQQIRNVLALSAKRMATNGKECSRKTGFGLIQAKDAFDLLDKYGCVAGGPPIKPLSRGGVGGCSQPIEDLTKLALQQASFPTTADASTANKCQRLYLKMLTDEYGYETSYVLKRVADGKVIKTGPPSNRKFEDNTDYSGPVSGCLEPGEYQFTIKDKFGDGFRAPGFYSLVFDRKTIANNRNFGSSETTTITVRDPNQQQAPQQSEWASLLKETFASGFGQFTQGGSNAIHVSSKFGRNGIVMVKAGAENYDRASVTSGIVRVNGKGYNRFKVVLSYYANGMDIKDRFCLDYAVNGSSTWIRGKCWMRGREFNNKKWYEDEEVILRPTAGTVNNIKIRVRGFSDSNLNRVFIDKIELSGRKE